MIDERLPRTRRTVVVGLCATARAVALPGCTHQGCHVAEVANGTINCPCHGSSFAVADRAVVTGRRRAPSRRAVTVENGGVRLGP